MARVAIIGAAGYVGLNLSKYLKDNGHEVIGITHSNGKFLLSRYGVRCEEPADVRNVGDVDVLINLAYPTGVSPLKNKEKNLELFGMIKYFADRKARIAHVSTQAVFGFDFDYPIVCGPVRNRRDYPYIEAKIWLENLLAASFGKTNELHILRLGNVWGPGSPTWTTNIVNRIFWNEPIGVADTDGYCNVADIQNIDSYLGFLAAKQYGTGVTFHHLAEMSAFRWSHWVSLIAEKLRQVPVYVDSLPDRASGIWNELKRQSRAVLPAAVAKELLQERYTGAMMRSVLSRTPQRVLDFMKTKRKVPSFMPVHVNRIQDMTYLGLMACQKQFKSVVDEGWKVPVDECGSWDAVRQWIEYAGYTD